VTVATVEHSVDAVHPFFNAQAALSDRPRDEARCLVSLEIGCEHWRYGVSLPRCDSMGNQLGTGVRSNESSPGPRPSVRPL
jgi:hypothetical protein